MLGAVPPWRCTASTNCGIAINGCSTATSRGQKSSSVTGNRWVEEEDEQWGSLFCDGFGLWATNGLRPVFFGLDSKRVRAYFLNPSKTSPCDVFALFEKNKKDSRRSGPWAQQLEAQAGAGCAGKARPTGCGQTQWHWMHRVKLKIFGAKCWMVVWTQELLVHTSKLDC